MGSHVWELLIVIPPRLGGEFQYKAVRANFGGACCRRVVSAAAHQQGSHAIQVMVGNKLPTLRLVVYLHKHVDHRLQAVRFGLQFLQALLLL